MRPQIAKLTRPRLAGVVERARLFKHLDRACRDKVLWISAPAGSGKTTLVANWLDRRKLPCLWYQADEGDGDIATFFSYMGKAAKYAAPRYREPLPLFTPEYSLGIPTFTKRYFEELYARLLSAHGRRAAKRGKRPVGPVLVIDNYQDVPADSLFHEIIRDGLSVAPEGISIVIISRADPSPAFARLQAGSRLELLPREEIWFTYEEAGVLVESRSRKRTPEDMLKSLFQKTEGWAAGLVLMSDSMGKQGELPAVADVGIRSVFDYFAEELLGRADPVTREFLMRTAFFPRMTARNAEELTENGYADQLLSRLGRSNFFIQRHATPELVYQYHPLFREFLLSRAKDSFGPDETSKIKKKAALLLLASGQAESAAELLAGTGDWEGYIPLVLTHAQSLAGQGRLATLTAWIERIPRPVFESQPWLVFWLGGCKKPVNPPESRALFESALNLFEAQGDRNGMFLSWAEIVDTFLYEWNDFTPLDRWIAWLENNMRSNPSFPAPSLEARVLSSMVDALIFRRPDHPEIKTWLERSQNNIEGIEDAASRMQAYMHVINYYLWTGDHINSKRIADNIKQIARASSATPFMVIISAWMESVVCHICSFEYDAALQLVHEGLEREELHGIHIWDHLLLTFGAFSALCKLDLAAAGEYQKKLETLITPGQYQNKLTQYHIASWIYYLSDDINRALDASVKALAAATEAGMIPHIALFNILVAHMYHAAGEPQKADAQLAAARQSVNRCQSLMLDHLYLLTESSIAMRRGEMETGLPMLRKALALGSAQGYLGMPFWWDPRMMGYLCAKALEEGIEVEYVKKLIRKRNLMPDPSSPAPESWPWPIRIHTLGRFELQRDDKPVIFSGKVQKKPLEMLKAVIALGAQDVLQDRLMDALWPDAAGDAARQSFDTTLHRLRKLLGDDEAILLRDGLVSLNSRRVWTDMAAFIDAESRAQSADWKNGDGSALAGTAVSLYRGNFLPGDAEQVWSLSARERLKTKFHRLVVRLGQHWIGANEPEKARECFERGLDADEISEELYQRLMECLGRMERRSEAAAVYQRCKNLLSARLGLEPSERTEELYRSIIRKP